MIFAPPKALDDEDIEYLNDAAERDKQRKDLIKAQEDQDLDAFKNARLSRTLHSAETPATPVPAAPSAPAPAPKARDVDVKVKVKVKVGNSCPSSPTALPAVQVPPLTWPC